MSKNYQSREYPDYGNTLLQSLYKCKEGCLHHAQVLEAESKKSACKTRSKADKARMKNAAKEYNEAALEAGVFISNLDNYDNID